MKQAIRLDVTSLGLWAIALIRKQPLPDTPQRLDLVLVGGIVFVAQSLSFYGVLRLLNPGLTVLLLYLYLSFVCLTVRR